MLAMFGIRSRESSIANLERYYIWLIRDFDDKKLDRDVRWSILALDIFLFFSARYWWKIFGIKSRKSRVEDASNVKDSSAGNVRH